MYVVPYLQIAPEKWSWNVVQKNTFLTAKKQLTAPCQMPHYNPESELTSLCDLLPNTFGAVLSQPNVDGPEKPVAFASQSLSPAERSTPN